jgi:hypothetical protein
MSAVEVSLYRLAHGRAGDKGNRLNLAVVCREERFFPVLADVLTAERVGEIFASRRPSLVVRYDLPKLHAFNFVLDDVLEGGVNASLGLDGHGKSLSFLLLAATVRVPAALVERETAPLRPAAE